MHSRLCVRRLLPVSLSSLLTKVSMVLQNTYVCGGFSSMDSYPLAHLLYNEFTVLCANLFQVCFWPISSRNVRVNPFGYLLIFPPPLCSIQARRRMCVKCRRPQRTRPQGWKTSHNNSALPMSHWFAVLPWHLPKFLEGRILFAWHCARPLLDIIQDLLPPPPYTFQNPKGETQEELEPDNNGTDPDGRAYWLSHLLISTTPSVPILPALDVIITMILSKISCRVGIVSSK